MTKQPIIRLMIVICALITFTGFRFPGLARSQDGAGQSDQETQREPHSRGAYPAHPRHIALLLPFSGNYGEAARAIREGFLASYYSSAPGTQKPIVRVYDTSKESDVQRIYQTAIAQGADFIVGPLTKEEVLRLSELSPRATKAPILALNYHPNARIIPGRMAQFSLLPETEAEQLAQKAWQQGYRRTSIIVPDNNWGRRIAGTFSQRWQSFGGQIIRTVYANPSDDQAKAVRRLLEISDDPKVAAEQRPDLDVIIMAADPLQARQLKPLFDFYYADQIPVYATSSIYSGQPNPGMDRDLNGVVFCDMPWLVDPARRQEIESLLVKHSENGTEFNRLFAMGVDAYHLTSELNRMQSGNPYAGSTGNLYMVNQQIQRNLAWAKMVNGSPRSLKD